MRFAAGDLSGAETFLRVSGQKVALRLVWSVLGLTSSLWKDDGVRLVTELGAQEDLRVCVCQSVCTCACVCTCVHVCVFAYVGMCACACVCIPMPRAVFCTHAHAGLYSVQGVPPSSAVPTRPPRARVRQGPSRICPSPHPLILGE